MFQKIDIDLSFHDDRQDLLVRFRLQTDSSGQDNGVYIDDVEIATGVAGDDYDYFQGTSMAAPHVSGLAGLIMAAFPTISNAAVKSRILTGVDPKSGLVGLTVSGGRINAQRSLAIPIAPSGLTARAASKRRVNLSWTDNSGLLWWTEEDGFRVYRKAEADGKYALIGTITPGAPGTGTTISFADGSVSAGRLYFYQVKAFNWGGNSEPTNESTAITPGGSGGATGGSGGCFIATAAYGSPSNRSIDPLRWFRDEYLVPHSVGKAWVELYYRYSPPMARFIADHPTLRKGARLILLPFVGLSAGMVQTTASQKGLILCLVVGLLLGMAFLSRQREAE